MSSQSQKSQALLSLWRHLVLTSIAKQTHTHTHAHTYTGLVLCRKTCVCLKYTIHPFTLLWSECCFHPLNTRLRARESTTHAVCLCLLNELDCFDLVASVRFLFFSLLGSTRQVPGTSLQCFSDFEGNE